MTDDKIILTPEDAESLLVEGAKHIHNFTSGPILIGCDYDRADAIKAFRAAASIELAGPGAMAMRHPIAVFEKGGRVTFFEADVDKAKAFEAAVNAKAA